MTSLPLLDYLGVAVFAASGALVASRREFDLVSFALLAAVAGIGGGTLRDLLLARPVFWIADSAYLLTCVGVAAAFYLFSPFIRSRYTWLLWADAIGLAAYGALGADIALREGAGPIVAVGMGIMTATFGGLARDLIAGEPPVALRREIHVTAAMLAALAFTAVAAAGGGRELAYPAALLTGFGLRAGAILRGWSLPRYRPRPGREY